MSVLLKINKICVSLYTKCLFSVKKLTKTIYDQVENDLMFRHKKEK